MTRSLPSRPFPRESSGFALVLSLWVLSILSFAVFTSGLLTRENLLATDLELSEFHARQKAASLVAIASHPLVENGDPLLYGENEYGELWETRITSEEARLPLNALLLEDGGSTLVRLFRYWELPEMEARQLVGALQDAVDEDGLERLNGAEAESYARAGFPGMPMNRPFQSLAEANGVRGMDALRLLRPGWQSSFTLFSSGPLDASGAEAELLAAATGASIETAETFVNRRNGFDGIPNTADDQPVDDLGPLTAAAGRPDAWPLTTQGSTLRIEARVTAGDARVGLGLLGRKSPAGFFPEHLASFQPSPDDRE